PPATGFASLNPSYGAPPPSQRIEKIDQILFLPPGESNPEPLVVEIHRVQQRRGGAVVKIGGARGQSTQDRSLDLAEVGALTGNQRTARVRHHKGLPRMRTILALQGENRQPGNIERRRTTSSGIGDADVQGRLDGVIAHIGSVVAGAAESRNGRQVERVI